MSLPVNSNLQNKKCAEAISSNCISYDGPAINGVCKGASMTEALFSVAESSAGCCEGSFPAGHQSCYTGDWVDFSTSISPSGLGGNYSYTTGSMGFSGFGNPSYRWTKDGDLKLRGRFLVTITKVGTFGGNIFFRIPMVTLPVSCFPTGASVNQVCISSIYHDVTDNLQDPVFAHGGPAIDVATGILYFDILFEKRDPGTFILDSLLGAITFNLA